MRPRCAEGGVDKCTSGSPQLTGAPLPLAPHALAGTPPLPPPTPAASRPGSAAPTPRLLAASKTPSRPDTAQARVPLLPGAPPRPSAHRACCMLSTVTLDVLFAAGKSDARSCRQLCAFAAPQWGRGGAQRQQASSAPGAVTSIRPQAGRGGEQACTGAPGRQPPPPRAPPETWGQATHRHHQQ